jgi:hydantoinase/carbamoylase family amidase
MASTNPLPIDRRTSRTLERLDTLFEIGRAAGTNRPGLGVGEQRACELVAGWMHEAGLEVSSDAGGNLLGRSLGGDPGAREVWSGSHLDTPPDGGRFDGALGTLAAVDAIEAIAATGGAARTLQAMAFRLEEGPRFGRGCFGSRAMVGELPADEADLRDADGTTLGEAFAALGLGSLPREGWLGSGPAAFVELHIEQGPTLAELGAPLGVVTSIAGMAGYELTFHGRRGHAGTTPMQLRADALAAAAGFVQRLQDSARGIPGAVATIGRLIVAPGATNTIPDRVELFADVRAPDAERLEAVAGAVVAAATEAAAAAGCRWEHELRWRYEPVPMGARPMAAIRAAIAGLGAEPVELPSGAGHDAQILAQAGVECGMLFVRSDAGGVSHAPEEFTAADAVELGLQALEATLRELAAA